MRTKGTLNSEVYLNVIICKLRQSEMLSRSRSLSLSLSLSLSVCVCDRVLLMSQSSSGTHLFKLVKPSSTDMLTQQSSYSSHSLSEDFLTKTGESGDYHMTNQHCHMTIKTFNIYTYYNIFSQVF